MKMQGSFCGVWLEAIVVLQKLFFKTAMLSLSFWNRMVAVEMWRCRNLRSEIDWTSYIGYKG